MKSPILNRHSFASLARALRAAPALRGKTLGSRRRELIILRVSSLNGCPVCSAAHGLWGRAVGLDPDEVRRVRACGELESFDPPTKAALEYAEFCLLGVGSSEAAAAVTKHFHAEALREIRAIVDLFVFTNRFNNSWERWLPGSQGRRIRLGLCPCEQSE